LRTPLSRGLGLLSLGLAAAALSGCLTFDAIPVANAKQDLILVAQADGAAEVSEAVDESTPSGAYLAGLQAGRDSDLRHAADFMLETLENDPENENLLSRTFMLVAAEGRHEDALRLARQVMALPEGNKALAQLVLTIDALVRDDLEDARAHLDSMDGSGLGAVLSPGIGAWMTLGAGNLDAAEDEMGPLKDRGGFKVLYLLHLALMAQENRAQAFYEQALAESGEPSLRLVRLAGSFFERTDPERAQELYGAFLEDSGGSSLIKAILARMEAGGPPPREVSDAKAGVAEFLFNMASLLSQERAQEIALVHLRQALRLRPEFDIGKVLLGEILQAQSRGEAAIAAYESVPESSPWYYLTRLRVADQLSDLERYDDAARVLENLAGAKRPKKPMTGPSPGSKRPCSAIGRSFISAASCANAKANGTWPKAISFRPWTCSPNSPSS
jgi:tetratricopeptide (TPR) repeat protein